jgi:hypothetical protein
LLTDYRSVKAIDGDVKPVTFFSFHHEISKACGIGFVPARLREQVVGVKVAPDRDQLPSLNGGIGSLDY